MSDYPMNLAAMIGPERLAKGLWWSAGCGLQLVEGCTKVSPGCDNCWSLTAANMRRFNPNPKLRARYEGTVYRHIGRLDAQCRECQDPPNECEGPCRPQWTGRVNPQWDFLDRIGCARTPKVYTIWNDLFHEGVEDQFVHEVFDRIERQPGHLYIICTKRPERALEYCRHYRDWKKSALRKRLMFMTTVENQAMADQRLPILLQIPGALHGVSYEPALGPVDFLKWIPGPWPMNEPMPTGLFLDWIVAGGETGPHARPSHPNYFRSARDQAVAAGAPFLFKSWGEWAPGSDVKKKTLCVYDDGRTVEFTREAILAEEKRTGLLHNDFNPVLMSRVGKRAAGRCLDEMEWDELPEVG